MSKFNFFSRDTVMLHIKLKGITNAAAWWQIFCQQTPLPPPPPPPRFHPWTPGLESKGQNSTFSENGYVAYQIKGNQECSNMVENILPAYPPPPPLGMGSIGQNSTFSEHGHVAYQSKRIKKCSNMVANILPADPSPCPLGLSWGWGQ